MFRKRSPHKHHPDFLRAYKAIEHRVEDLVEELPGVKERKKKKKFLGFLRVLVYIGLTAVVVIVVVGFFIVGDLWQLYRTSTAGKANLESSIQNIYSYEFGAAAVSASKAKENFDMADSSLEDLRDSFLVSNIQYFDDQFRELEYLLQAGYLLSDSLVKGTELAQQINVQLRHRYDADLSFGQFTEKERRGVLRVVYESAPTVKGILGNLRLASSQLEKVKTTGLLKLYQTEIKKLRVKLAAAIELSGKAEYMCEVLPWLAGYPSESNFLLILQNSDELRPSGGFVGTYGLVATNNGVFKRLETHDIYHMDMPVKDIIDIEPPRPIKQHLNDKWFMRDANWSPHWPDSARELLWFYNLEDKLLPAEDQINNFSGEFDGVIGITPDLVEDLLSIVGPVIVEGTEYNQENFTRLLEYRVERGYVQLGEPSWHRKEVIGKILQQLKVKIFDLPFSHWGEVANIVRDNASKKNILLYFEDEHLQGYAERIGVDGGIKQVDNDYLMIVDANMGARKTDAVMKKSVQYRIKEKKGEMYVDLIVNYSHPGGIDWRTSDYKTYTRVYTSYGSELINVRAKTGHEEKQLPIDVTQEHGKTVFGTFLTIKEGEVGSLYLEYKLADKISEVIDQEGYKLYFQKQPGNNFDNIVVDVELEDKVKSYNPIGFYADKINDRRVRWSGELRRDRRFEIQFVGDNH